MAATTVRSSNSTALMWGGALVVVTGGFTGLYGLVPLLQGSLIAGIVWILFGALICVVGIAVLAVGWRTSARLDRHGVSWAHGLTGRRSVPWQQIAYVHVPGRDEPGNCVMLQLHNGSTVPVVPLRKTQGPDQDTALSLWYLRAGATVQHAHQQWLAGASR